MQVIVKLVHEYLGKKGWSNLKTRARTGLTSRWTAQLGWEKLLAEAPTSQPLRAHGHRTRAQTALAEPAPVPAAASKKQPKKNDAGSLAKEEVGALSKADQRKLLKDLMDSPGRDDVKC